MRRALPADVACATRFARCQLRAPLGNAVSLPSLDGVWQGEPVTFVPEIRPLIHEYALRLYAHAAREAIGRFPLLGGHVVEDGPDLGERRLRFTTGQPDLALSFMMGRFWQLMDDEIVEIADGIRVEPDTHRFGGPRRMNVVICLDGPSLDAAGWERIAAHLSTGAPPTLDPRPRACDRKLTAALRTTLSLPELVLLNWNAVRKPLSEADAALFRAIEWLDPAAIVRALAAGADPNALDEMGDSAIANVVRAEPWEHAAAMPGETWEQVKARFPSVTPEERLACLEPLVEAGASLDLCGPQGTNPVTMAVLRADHRVLDWLLARGADDTVHSEDEEGHWPMAWSFASSERVVEGRLENEETRRTLRRHRQAPTGTLPGEDPDW